MMQIQPTINKVIFSVALLLLTSAAIACDPAIPDPKELLTNASVAVVKGNILHVPTKNDPNHAVLNVTESLRGKITSGKYEIAEGGPFGSHCEYGEMSVSYQSKADDGINLKIEKAQYFFVNEKKGNTLIVPIGLDYGLAEINGFVVRRYFGERISVKKFTDYLRSNSKNTAAPTWIVDKK
jgi:hypothetical protein